MLEISSFLSCTTSGGAPVSIVGFSVHVSLRSLTERLLTLLIGAKSLKGDILIGCFPGVDATERVAMILSSPLVGEKTLVGGSSKLFLIRH